MVRSENQVEESKLNNHDISTSGGNVLKGTVIIGMAGIVVKILGAIFKIPLTNWVGSEGMSYYQVAYNIYNAFIIMAIAGFPVAISKLVSENIAKKRFSNAERIFRVAIGIVGVIGGLSAGICFFGGDLLAARMGNPLAALALRAISPALFFVPIVSAFRGFFQGRQNMRPTALSEIIEQLFRVIVGFILARVFLSKGLPETAAGASFGATVGSIIALVFMIIVFLLHKDILAREKRAGDEYLEDVRSIAKKILVIAIPIIIGAEIMPIMYLIDTGLIMNRLQQTGWTEDESKYLYGLMSGYCNSLIAMPEFLIQAIAISMVPAISSANAIGDKKSVEGSIGVGYKLTPLIAFPCMVGLIVMCKPIFTLLFPLKIDEAMDAVPLFIILTASIVTIALYETSTGTLQAIGKQVIPVRNVVIGAVIKIALTFILVGIHGINVKGAAISSVVAFFVAFVLNEIAVKKYTGIKIKAMDVYIKPFAASAIMGIVVFAAYKLLSMILGNTISTGLSILIGVITYGIIVVVIRIATPSEIAAIPYGHKLNGFISKFTRWED